MVWHKAHAAIVLTPSGMVDPPCTERHFLLSYFIISFHLDNDAILVVERGKVLERRCHDDNLMPRRKIRVFAPGDHTGLAADREHTMLFIHHLQHSCFSWG